MTVQAIPHGIAESGILAWIVALFQTPLRSISARRDTIYCSGAEIGDTVYCYPVAIGVSFKVTRGHHILLLHVQPTV